MSWLLYLLSPVQTWDFEIDDGGFVSTGDTGQWEWGEIRGGPGSGYDGRNGWATVLDGDHLNDSVDTLSLPSSIITDLDRPILGFHQWLDIDTEGDFGTVEVFIDDIWVPIEPIYGYSSSQGFSGTSDGWESVFFSLDGIEDLSNVRLRFDADEIVARFGWAVDNFALWDGDPVPPSIGHLTEPEDSQDLVRGPELMAEIFDDREVIEATLAWETDRGDSGELAMTEVLEDSWSAQMPSFSPDTTVSWTVYANDGVNETSAVGTSYRVYLPAPSDLTGPTERLVATEFELGWSAPSTEHTILFYRVYRNDSVEIETTEEHALVTARDANDSFRVSAHFDTEAGEFEGDSTSSLQVDIAIPEITTLVPDHGWAGDELRTTIRGEYLLLAQSDADLDLGPDITVIDVEVLDVDTAIFTLEISADSAPGTHDLTLFSGPLEMVMEDAFEVLADSDRPGLVAVTPDAVEQGESATLCIELDTPLEGSELRVDFGDGIYVLEATSDGLEVWVDIVVDLDAPIGLHGLRVDDGIRIRDGLSLRVRDRRVPVQTICGSIPAHSPSPARTLTVLFCVLITVGQRRRSTVPSNGTRIGPPT